MKPKTIFKYMPTYSEWFFDHFLLRATPRNELNDPFEFVPTKSFYDWSMSIPKEDWFKKIPYNDFCRGFRPSSGIISFSETRSNLLMWSHYSENHKGLVIEFDTSNKFYDGLERVRYDNVKPDFVNELDDLFFIKSDEWIYEKEFRIIKDLTKHDFYINRTELQKILPAKNSAMCSPNQSPEMYMFLVPRDSIASVVFGCNATKEFKENIISKINNNISSSIPIYESILSETHFHLEFSKIN